MASTKLLFLISIICFFNLLYTQAHITLDSQLPDIRMLRSCNIDKIFQLGDSISDTGNRKVENPFDVCSQFPYGKSLHQPPTGRCSDGLLMIDHIAQAAGLPLLNPYLNSDANFKHGVNFAVGGSTALSADILAKKNITLYATKSSLEVQLEWMSNYIASACDTEIDCSRKKLENALFMVGEIGGNDYNIGLSQDKDIEKAKSMVPEVVQLIMDAVRRVIDFGAVRVVVPGNFPIGCLPIYLTSFQSNNATAYDKHQCLNDLNQFAVFHNEYLQQAISTLEEEYPNTIIVYADYYNNTFLSLLQNSRNLGFDEQSTLKACCGSGDFSFLASGLCGSPNAGVCSDPDKYISWDGIHLTQKAYELLANWIVADFVPKLKCNTNISYY